MYFHLIHSPPHRQTHMPLPLHLPPSFMTFLFNPLSPVSTAYSPVGVGPSTEPWGAYQGPQPWRKPITPHSEAKNCRYPLEC